LNKPESVRHAIVALGHRLKVSEIIASIKQSFGISAAAARLTLLH